MIPPIVPGLIAGIGFIALGTMLRKYPEKFIRMPFFKGPSTAMLTSKGRKAFFRGHEAAYGKEESINWMKKYGTWAIGIGLFVIAISPFLHYR